jgi:two-component system chemotaxis sensor kinase CheA
MEFLRIDGAKVTALMDLAGELGLACSAVTRHPELAGRDLDGFATAAHKLELLVREIQNDLSALRLVPVAPLFQRMRRVVRDAAKTVHKDIELVIVGEETEVDKVMLDAIQDPLIHILRNSVDHGLETADERAAAGKPATGRITLSATQLGGEVSVEVRDDGRGINRERVLARARERGLYSGDGELSDAEVASFIFLPGFSTKAQADELSGRGVGMDVVKTTVEGLRGRVVLTSKPNIGSRVTMTMPLTLAFVEAMVVREHGRLFALPIEKVFEVSKVDGSRVVTNPTTGQTTLWVRESCVPVVWLHRFWAEPRSVSAELHGRLVVLVQTSRGAVAVPVDELIGNQQVMLKPLRGALAKIRAASGCGMLRTGDVAIALDCDRLYA